MTPDWISKDGTVQLYCADCRTILKGIDAGVCIVDPPYGIDHESNGQIFKSARKIAGDETPGVACWVADWADVFCVPLAMFFSPYRYMVGGWRSVLVWDKGAHLGGGGDPSTCWKRDFELIGVRRNRPLNGQRDSAVLRFLGLLPPPTGHVAEKPVELLGYLIDKLSERGETIIDPCMGTASCGVAAVLRGRKYIGIETDAEWFAVSVRRIQQAFEDQSLFRPEVREIQGELSLTAPAAPEEQK